jgi:dTDP-glucose 4,6-dehydratase
MRGCDAVIHLAALIAIPYSYAAPAAYVDTNINGTLNILEAARELGVKKIIHTSTSEVYGTAKYVPIDESHSLNGQSPYAATKIGADQLALSYYASFETPVAVLRPFNTYGPRQSARAVIPTIITQIASGKKEIRLGSITPTRDFNYVADTVSGFIAALNAENVLGEVVNIGSSYEVSIKDTFDMIAKVMNSDAEIIADTVRLRPQESEVERLWADNSKAKELFGWQPTYSGHDGFRRGLSETIAWFVQTENLRSYKSDLYNL